MSIITAEAIDRLLTFPALIDALQSAFSDTFVVPVRHHHSIDMGTGADGSTLREATHLLMPAWSAATARERYLGCKIVNVFPDNAAQGLPSIHGTYVLMSGTTGATLAIMDGTRLTAWRTAAASALAARFLARADASTMLMVGAGSLAPMLIQAHAAVRPIREVLLWNRNPDASVKLATDLAHTGLKLRPVDDLEAAARLADVISCATLSKEPLIKGAWLKPGTHLDLVGAYTPAMRESDDEAVQRSYVIVDTLGGALKEGGDIALPLKAGLIDGSHIKGDLHALSRGVLVVQRSDTMITLFKSVGTAIEDLAAAMLVWHKLKAGGHVGQAAHA
jgi:ornithine cyclodeaminase/alanine dehydrogenase-like protein (mu-crystallin family)